MTNTKKAAEPAEQQWLADWESCAPPPATDPALLKLRDLTRLAHERGVAGPLLCGTSTEQCDAAP